MLLTKKKRMRIGGLLIGGFMGIVFATSAYAAEEDPGTVSLDDVSISLNADSIPDELWNKGFDFGVRKDNSVRSITVTGTNIETYQNIHVGDSINKVRSKYQMEYEQDDWVVALMSGETELDTASVLGMDEESYTDEILDAVFLQYTYENDVVTKIYIARVYTMLDMDAYTNPDAEVADVQLERNQVYVNGEILTYNETVPDALKVFSAELTKLRDLPAEVPVKIIVNDEGIVRAIQITSRAVKTYDGITVGMNKDDITAKYEKCDTDSRYVTVYYDGNELLAEEDMPVDDYFSYSYNINDNGIITSILICDKQFAEHTI